MLGIKITNRLSEGWYSVAYIAQVNTKDLTVYTNVAGECAVDSVVSLEGLHGYMLTDEEADKFMDLFSGQEMTYYWYGIYRDERDRYNSYEYDVIFDMAYRRLMIDTDEGVAYYVADKEKTTEPSKFELSGKQEEFIEDLIDKYGTADYSKLIKNIVFITIVCVIVATFFIIRKRRNNDKIMPKTKDAIEKLEGYKEDVS